MERAEVCGGPRHRHHKHIQKNVILCTIYYHPKRAQQDLYTTDASVFTFCRFHYSHRRARKKRPEFGLIFAATDASRVFIYHCSAARHTQQQQNKKKLVSVRRLFGAICAHIYRIVCFNLRRSPCNRSIPFGFVVADRGRGEHER